MKKLLLTLLLAFPCFADFNSAKTVWESHMTSYGQQNCDRLSMNNANLIHTYYDAERVFYQIADYTGNTSTWNNCAQKAEIVYRNNYVTPNNGQVPGYWVFPHGLRMDFARTSDTLSQNALTALSQKAAFCTASAYEMAALPDPQYQREAAYCLMLMLERKKLNAPTPYLTQYYGFVKGHIKKQFIDHTTAYHQPFMVALGAEALIQYYTEVSQDVIIPTYLESVASQMWTSDWDATSQSFKYYESGSWTPSVDLNLLIGPMWGWLYYKTNNTIYRTRGDTIFEKGVTSAYLGSGKQFNQNYRWSFDYVTWRAGMATPTPTPSPTPCDMSLTLAGHECRISKLEAMTQ